MTPANVDKVKSAIADCDRYINKEDGRRADLRPADVQKRLDGYKAHRAELLAMLAKG